MMLRIILKTIGSMVEIPSRTKGKKNKDVGMKEFFKFYKDKYYTKKSSSYNISESKYRSIVSEFNKLIAEKIVKGPYDFKMPCKLGYICLRKYKKKPKIDKDGGYKYDLPVDWKSTLELWERDPEAAKKKKLIKYLNKDTGGYIFRIFYFKKSANYKNRAVYSFSPVRGLKHLLRDSVRKDITDAYEI